VVEGAGLMDHLQAMRDYYFLSKVFRGGKRRERQERGEERNRREKSYRVVFRASFINAL
jgi:hypothetical protein